MDNQLFKSGEKKKNEKRARTKSNEPQVIKCKPYVGKIVKGQDNKHDFMDLIHHKGNRTDNGEDAHRVAFPCRIGNEEVNEEIARISYIKSRPIRSQKKKMLLQTSEGSG